MIDKIDKNSPYLVICSVSVRNVNETSRLNSQLNDVAIAVHVLLAHSG